MNINELTLGDIKQISQFLALPATLTNPTPTAHPLLKIGAKLEIRTVTLFYTGEVVHIDDQWITITSVGWIADEGRFTDTMKTGEFQEVEVLPDGELMTIGIGSVISINRVPNNTLPRSQK